MDTLDRLTPRQQMIAVCVKKGMTNVEIGETLGISRGCVANQLRDVYRRLNIKGSCHVKKQRLAILIAQDNVERRRLVV
jgi:DNA-binding NarL/FixJ family response regulator